MTEFEGQLFDKTKSLIKRKRSRLRDFECLILEDEHVSIISSMDEREEDFQDLLIFSTEEELKSFDYSAIDEIQDIEEFKIRILNNYECKISEYGELSNEEALRELEYFIEDSKVIASVYFENFRTSFQRLLRKLTIIKHILVVEKKFERAKFNYLNIQRNLKNLTYLITADNAQNLLIKNLEKLEASVEEKFEDFLKIISKIDKIKMNPCELLDIDCPSPSDNSSNSDSLYDDVESPSDAKEDESKASDCFFVNRSSETTRMDSIERLKTDLSKLEEQIESIEEEKSLLRQEIELKKSEILDALKKVAEFEENLESIDCLFEDKLYNFQQRIISLELKLNDNFKITRDQDMKNLLENEIYELKETFRSEKDIDEENRNELTQQGQIFAASIGNVLSDITKFSNSTKVDENFTLNVKKLQNLISRPPKFCYDSKGRRFYFNSDKVKIFQDEDFTAHYKINQDSQISITRQGFSVGSDENGEFYCDSKKRKIYTKFYFDDDFGRYYIDIHGDRHYKADSEASEYMLVNGVWIKSSEGTYERDEKGMRVVDVDLKDESENLSLASQPEEATKKHKLSNDDMKYIKDTVGPAIVKACAATYLHRPTDPLSYFANFLLHFRFTEKMFEARNEELNYFIQLRDQLKTKCDVNQPQQEE